MPTLKVSKKSNYASLKQYLDIILDFVLENHFLVITVIFVWLKTVGFNYLLGLFENFPTVKYFLAVSLVVVFVTFSPLLFVKKHKNLWITVVNLFFSLVMIVDLVYFRYFNALPSTGILNTAGQSKDVLPAVVRLFRWSDLLFVVDVVGLLYLEPLLLKLTKRFDKIKARVATIQKRVFKFAVFALSIIALIFLCSFSAEARAIFRRSIDNVWDNKVNSQYYGVIAAHYLDIYRNVSQNFHFLSEKERNEALDWINQHKYKQENNQFTGTAKAKNIIIIQVESLDAFVINKKAEGQEITPNINKLFSGAHYFDNNYFMIGGGGTSDADMSVNTSLYPLSTESAFVKYGKADYTSIAKELSKENYSAYAYHAYNGSFWNREVAFKSLGFEKFFGSESFPKGETVNMGLNDKTFFEKTAEYIKDQPKPSLSYVITLSSHTPFNVPQADRHLKLTDSKYPWISESYLENVHYTDEALGIFLQKLKDEGLYDDSLIVLYGDHKASIDYFSINDLALEPNIEGLKVPLVVKLPGQKSETIHEEVSSHLDIMPTILNLAGIKTNSPMFGRDLFSKNAPYFSGVGLFNAGTVFKNDLRTYINASNARVCEKETNKGSYNATNPQACNNLTDEAAQIKKYSDMLIRYDLFKYFK